MTYQSDSNGNDCITEVLAICGATTNTYSVNNITRRFNLALDSYFDIAQDAAGNWPFDDVNQTDSGISTQDIVSGTNKYKISSFTGSAVNIHGVTILDSNGTLRTPSKENFLEVDFETDYSTTYTGTPSYYLLYGNWIYLRPSPNYSETAGLRVYSDRTPLYMLPADTTKEPGVPKKHHL